MQSASPVKELSDLGDLVELVSEDAAHASSDVKAEANKPYETTRTASWLKATASQLLIALNSLSSLGAGQVDVACLTKRVHVIVHCTSIAVVASTAVGSNA